MKLLGGPLAGMIGAESAKCAVRSRSSAAVAGFRLISGRVGGWEQHC